MFKKNLRKIRDWWSDYNWLILIILGVIGLTLGFIGFQKNGLAVGKERTLLDNLYLTLGLISMETGVAEGPIPWELQVGRFLVPAVTAYTAILAFTALFIKQTDRIRLWSTHDHILICGLGRKGFRLAKGFLEEGHPVVVVEINEANEWVENIRAKGAIVIHGDAADPTLLEKVKLKQAHCLISVLGDDGKNAEVALQAEKLSRGRKSGTLTCIIHIFDARLWDLLREKELHGNHNSRFRLELFNIFDRGARRMLGTNPPWNTHPQHGPTRILIVGLGKMGQRLVAEAARQWRVRKGDTREKIHISVLDLKANQKVDTLNQQYPRLGDICVLEALEMNILSPAFERVSDHFIKDNQSELNAIYICLDDESFSLQTGLRLNHQLREQRIPIILRMAESGGLASLLAEEENDQNAFGNLRIFDLLDQTCTPDLLQKGTHEILARHLHAAYLEGLPDHKKEKPRMDARSAWEQLSPALKEKNRQQADRIPQVLVAAGYRIDPLRDWEAERFQFAEGGKEEEDEVVMMASVEHELWRQTHIDSGWRVGPRKDPEKKTHPHLVSWEKLPASEKRKNKKFIRDLPRILARAGFQVMKIKEEDAEK
ncbi:MAG: NAD-binding protein [Anaerolineales bacterium]